MKCERCNLCKTRKRIVALNGLYSAKYILITDYPTKIDETIGKIFCGEERKLFQIMIQDACTILDITPWEFLIIPMIRCRPQNDEEPEPKEILACASNLMREINRTSPKQIFFNGKLVEQYYKKEFSDAITLQSIHFIADQGGYCSPWYISNIRLLTEGIKK